MSESLGNPVRTDADARAAAELHPLDLLIILSRHKKLVIGMPIATGLLAMLLSLQMTPVFTSTAKILPPQQKQNSGLAAMLGQLGGLAGAPKDNNDMYIGFLESRSVADALIGRFKLAERYGARTMDEARNALRGASEFAGAKKDGLIWITVHDADPKFAARLANAYVEELGALTSGLALTEASQRRLFFELQLKDAADQLGKAELALRKTQEQTGMIQPDGQLRAIIGNIATLKAGIASKEVELNAMRVFATGQNPALLRAQEELRGMRLQLAKVEKNQAAGDGDFMVPTGKLPAVGVEYQRSLRMIKYRESVFELLAKQYESAKIDEAKDTSLIQLLDKAVPPERRSKPKRSLLTLVGALFGGALGVFLAFVLEAYARSRENPRSRGRWNELARAWGRAPRK
ncbi:MAG: Wzz/FepE/Etk N-terminal domain-containing protein [Pseudomonadota bacterium]